jgi:flagellar biosynthetic protein FlhB
MSDQSQKTEKPTQKRVQKARREGRFFTSREFVGSLQFLAVVMILSSWGEGWYKGLQHALVRMMDRAFKPDFDQGDLFWLGSVAARDVFGPVLVAGAVVWVFTLAVQLAVTKLGFSLHRLVPEMSKLDPLKRLKELPKQNLGAALQATATLAFCLVALYHVASRNADTFYLLPLAPLDSSMRRVFAAIGDLLWKSAAVFLVLGCWDFARARFRYQSQMRMSKQEIREEYKEVEGSPAIKARIRRLQRGLLRRKMMREVPKATALIVNPTHYAVAIKYELDTASAPMVVAKGKNYLALRIRELATRHDVPLVESPPLARALYEAVPVGSEIPVHLYRAVAEILAYVYRNLRN